MPLASHTRTISTYLDFYGGPWLSDLRLLELDLSQLGRHCNLRYFVSGHSTSPLCACDSSLAMIQAGRLWIIIKKILKSAINYLISKPTFHIIRRPGILWVCRRLDQVDAVFWVTAIIIAAVHVIRRLMITVVVVIRSRLRLKYWAECD